MRLLISHTKEKKKAEYINKHLPQANNKFFLAVWQREKCEIGSICFARAATSSTEMTAIRCYDYDQKPATFSVYSK